MGKPGKTYEISRIHIVSVVLALILGALLVPVAAQAATGQFVNIRDYVNTAKGGKARVTGHKVWVGDGSGPLTVDGTVQTAPTAPHTGTCQASGSTTTVVCSFSVPVGRRLVIETVSTVVDLPAGKTAAADLRVVTGGEARDHALPLSFQRRYGGGVRDYFSSSLPVRLYADAGSIVMLRAHHDGGGLCSIQLTVSGHLS